MSLLQRAESFFFLLGAKIKFYCSRNWILFYCCTQFPISIYSIPYYMQQPTGTSILSYWLFWIYLFCLITIKDMLTYQNWLFAGSEGWLDNVGYFRLKDYIADKNGYRILKSKTVYIGKGHTMKVMFCQFCSNFIKLHSTFVYICIYHFKFIEITANICKNFTNSNIEMPNFNLS